MRINHNISALNTYRQLSSNTTATSKSLEKLSSGLRVNRAGDDAAGLAISEKMRSQIRGLDQASKNGSDGISLIQTAEGALTETHSILQRMKELAVQAATDTNTTSDRKEIQKEINQLTSEITRIAKDTEFNTKKLLDGSAGLQSTFDAKTVNGANVDWINITGGTGDTKATNAAVVIESASKAAAATSTLTVTGTAGDKEISINGVTINYTLAGTTGATNAAVMRDAINAVSDMTGVTASGATDQLVLTSKGIGSSSKIDLVSAANTITTAAATAVTAGTDASMTVTGGTIAAADMAANGNTITVIRGDYKGLEFSLNADLMHATAANNDATFRLTGNDSLTLHIGANSGQSVSLSIGKMDAKSLGVGALDLTTQKSADGAIKTVDDAIQLVSGERAKLGAMQNRLEHTINNLNTSSENLSAAESRIRDVDMAKEMMEFTKNNILSQASQAMLAQANQMPQGVLQLLQ